MGKQIQIPKPQLKNPPKTVPTMAEIRLMEKNGSLKSNRRGKKTKKSQPQNPASNTTPAEPETTKPKRETFAQTVLKVLAKTSKPTNRADLVKKCIKANQPTSKRPEWVYNDVVSKLEKKGLVVIDKSKGRNKRDHMVSLPQPS